MRRRSSSPTVPPLFLKAGSKNTENRPWRPTMSCHARRGYWTLMHMRLSVSRWSRNCSGPTGEFIPAIVGIPPLNADIAGAGCASVTPLLNVRPGSGRLCISKSESKSFMKYQHGLGLLSALLVVVLAVVAATTVYATWGPVYEVQCVEPSDHEIEGAKTINELVSSPFGGEYSPQPKCSKVFVR